MPPEIGQLVRVRGQQWVVSEVSAAAIPVDELAATALPGRTLTTLTSVSEDDLGEELSVVWEVEPGRTIIPSGALPDVPTRTGGTTRRPSGRSSTRCGGERSPLRT